MATYTYHPYHQRYRMGIAGSSLQLFQDNGVIQALQLDSLHKSIFRANTLTISGSNF
jgi:hypothetical protein